VKLRSELFVLVCELPHTVLRNPVIPTVCNHVVRTILMISKGWRQRDKEALTAGPMEGMQRREGVQASVLKMEVSDAWLFPTLEEQAGQEVEPWISLTKLISTRSTKFLKTKLTVFFHPL
jgi:hypothetical protein